MKSKEKLVYDFKWLISPPLIQDSYNAVDLFFQEGFEEIQAPEEST